MNYHCYHNDNQSWVERHHLDRVSQRQISTACAKTINRRVWENKWQLNTIQEISICTETLAKEYHINVSWWTAERSLRSTQDDWSNILIILLPTYEEEGAELYKQMWFMSQN